MKKKMLLMVIVVVVIIALFLAGWYVAFCKFGIGPVFPFLPVADVEIDRVDSMQLADNPLMAVVDTEEEAREIAELYGITFASYDNGVATYQTDEDPFQVITRGQENGYPQLSLNFGRKLLDDSETQIMEQKIFEQQIIE